MQATEPTGTAETGVYHDGDEVTVRTNSQYSRSWHVPKTDDDGNVVFDADDRPVPACDTEPRRGTFRLAPCNTVTSKTPCKNCTQDDDTISERNAKGSGNATLARLAQRSDWNGAESLSGNASHTT